jgi:L,D-transpeptidase catalytic domain
MPPPASLRVSIYVTYAFSLFSVVTAAPSAFAEVLISVNKSTQQMSVSVDGVPRYRFTVSTGRAGYGTPNGTYHPQHLAASWFSKLYYNSPMPHSIFFHGGYAIHGSYEISRLGGPASHGCIRLHPANAASLFALVKSEGMAATTIVVSGSSPVSASSHAPLPRRYGARQRPSSEDRYRSDEGQPSGYYWRPEQPSDYHWRPEPRVSPFFNSY